jgi:glycosyltransferase involved in cell wall biosynthesis
MTVGDRNRKTGGYLYNARVVSGLRGGGPEVREIVACGASPNEQRVAAPRLGSAFDPSGFDVIVADALARIAVFPHLDSWRATRPVVALVHELPSVAGGGPGRGRHYEEPLLRSDRLVAVSGHGRDVLRNRGVPPWRIHVVPPGFDGVPAGDASRSEGGGQLRVLCVAQWIPRKGILDLVEAWTLRGRTDAVLELVGETDADPDYAARVRAAIEVAPRGSIVVSGRVDDATLGEAYASADVFAMPSRYEGYGIVYAEALARGLPIIACYVGPVPELVGREAAVLVRPEDNAALSGAMDLLLGDPALRARMSEAASRRASGLPRWEDTVAGFENVLESVAGYGKEAPVQNPTADPRALREQNRLSWNAVVGAHDSHRGDLPGFLSNGGSTLFPEELGLLGGLQGKTLLHLQCNSGGDSLSLAGLGAEVTGVDISDEAVTSARRLARQSGIPATFERADVYDWLEEASRKGISFDIVFASYGVVCWLHDLDAWAGGIARILNPCGRFVLVDFHPTAEIFDSHWNHVNDYPSGGEPMLLDEGVGDYVAASGGGLTPAGHVEGTGGFENPEKAHLFRWGLGEVVTALARAGLKIAALQEYPYANGERSFAGMRELPGRRLAPSEGVPGIPLMYGIRAERG